MGIRNLLTAKPIRLQNSNSATFCKCIESSWRNQYEMDPRLPSLLWNSYSWPGVQGDAKRSALNPGPGRII
ncbi:MAG: hypothetical protein Q8O18_04685, partial [Deltaproteobacteria bacterium]|nr:hypothetical protein [Deltaproteobacteria bacterium]